MADKKQPEKLIPEIKQSAKPELLSGKYATIHKPGHYLIEQPDGLLTNITPKMYERAFKGKEGFTVKKSPNQ